MAQTVRFESFSPILFKDAVKAARRPIGARGELYLPRDGTKGPWPAVVIMEGLGGLKNARERAYGKWLSGHGYAVLLVDSFGSRGSDELPHNARAVLVTEAMMCADAYAALRFLRSRPEIEAGRIAVLGFSYGGMVSVLTAYEQVRRLFAAGEEQFAGHAALYGCSIIRLDQPRTTGKPVLMLLGEKDRNVSILRSRLIADDLRRGGADVSLEVLNGSYHQWDSDDIERRLVAFNLNSCRVRFDETDQIRDEGSGWTLRGRLSRALFLMLRADGSGYHIQRDEDAVRRSNLLLLSFLARVTGGRKSPAAKAHRRDATAQTAS